MKRTLRWIALILLFAVVVWGVFFLKVSGIFLTLEPKAAGVCTTVTDGGIAGIEDLTIDPDTHIAYLAGYDRRAALAGKTVRGAIWGYDLKNRAGALDLTAAALPEGFHPHGISLYRAPDGQKTLFVINHANQKHTIEIFDIAGTTLKHRRTVTGPQLISPNDIVGVGPDAFYVTNDHKYRSGLMRIAEDFLRLPLTTVEFYDGKQFSTALTGLGGSNGINVSGDGRTLYVSAASELTVYVYDRDPQTNVLAKRAAIAVPGFADNIEVLTNGDLLLGVHSKLFDLLAHFADASARSPSHIMLLKANGKGGFTPQTVYYNLGEEISGASVGASIGKRLLIGSIFEPKILDCTWEGAPQESSATSR
ncbi:MAG: Arylesterase [Betaproteobacteria bacterium ADurb.Bin341]|nr:MAG: Arylesterase [Betaproteobacteria bacterium ADurb.Bin341]